MAFVRWKRCCRYFNCQNQWTKLILSIHILTRCGWFVHFKVLINQNHIIQGLPRCNHRKAGCSLYAHMEQHRFVIVVIQERFIVAARESQKRQRCERNVILCVGENPTLLPAKKSFQIFGPTSQPTQSVLAKTIMTHPISETNLFGISPGRFLYCTIDHIRWRRWIKVGCILLDRQRGFPRRRRRGRLGGVPVQHREVEGRESDFALRYLIVQLLPDQKRDCGGLITWKKECSTDLDVSWVYILQIKL